MEYIWNIWNMEYIDIYRHIKSLKNKTSCLNFEKLHLLIKELQ